MGRLPVPRVRVSEPHFQAPNCVAPSSSLVSRSWIIWKICSKPRRKPWGMCTRSRLMSWRSGTLGFLPKPCWPLSSFVEAVIPLPQGSREPPSGEEREVVERVGSVVRQAGFLKKVLASKDSGVRRAAYTLLATLTRRLPQVVEESADVAAPLVLGAFSERDPGAHARLWDMLLTFVRSFPGAWARLDPRKAVLPRLLAFLRQGCYGSGETSYAALLPLLGHMPPSLLGGPSGALPQILDSVWTGWEAASGQLPARQAAAASFLECFRWSLSNAETLSPGEPQGLVTAVLEGPLCGRVLPASLAGSSAAQDEALDALLACISLSCQEGGQPWVARACLNRLGEALASQLSSRPGESVYERVGVLFRQLHGTLAERKDLQIGETLARPVFGALLPVVQGSATVPAAAALMASLLELFGPLTPPQGDPGRGLRWTRRCGTALRDRLGDRWRPHMPTCWWPA
eukprot:jgi/Botrbrau1/845/Bobra.0352s0039.1